MLGLLDRHAVDMVDLLAGGSRRTDAASRRARSRRLGSAGQAAPRLRRDRAGHRRRRRRRRGRVGVALAHHHPAHIVDDRSPRWLTPASGHRRRRSAVGVLLQPDHLGSGGQRVAGIDRLSESGHRRSRDWRPRSARCPAPSCRRRCGRRAGRRPGAGIAERGRTCRRSAGEARAVERRIERDVAALSVRGVACRSVSPRRKSSKKRPARGLRASTQNTFG